jgi:hypothetical protein
MYWGLFKFQLVYVRTVNQWNPNTERLFIQTANTVLTSCQLEKYQLTLNSHLWIWCLFIIRAKFTAVVIIPLILAACQAYTGYSYNLVQCVLLQNSLTLWPDYTTLLEFALFVSSVRPHLPTYRVRFTRGKWTSILLRVTCSVWTLTCPNFEARQVISK